MHQRCKQGSWHERLNALCKQCWQCLRAVNSPRRKLPLSGPDVSRLWLCSVECSVVDEIPDQARFARGHMWELLKSSGRSPAQSGVVTDRSPLVWEYCTMLYDMLEHRLLAIPPRDSIPRDRMAEYVCRLDSWGSGHSPGPVSGNFCGFEYDPAERTMSLDTVPLLKHTSEARARQLVEDASLAASFFDAIIEQLDVREQLVQAMSRYGASYLSTTMLLFGVGTSYADIARLEGVGEFTSNLLYALLEAMAVQCPYPIVIDSEANTPLAARLSPLMGVSRSSLDARPVKRISSPNLIPGQGMTFATTRDDLLDVRSRVHASIMRPAIELEIPAESRRLFREYFVNTSEFGRLTELLPKHHGTHFVLFEFTSSDTGAFLSNEQVFVDIRDALRVFVEKCESTAPGGEHYPHKSVVLSGTDSEAVRPYVTLSVPPFLSVDRLFTSGRVTSDHDLCYVCQVQE